MTLAGTTPLQRGRSSHHCGCHCPFCTSANVLAFAADTPPDGHARRVCDSMNLAVEALDPGSTSWVERYVARLNEARDFLTGLGMKPVRAEPDALVPMWRVPMWTGLFSNDELVALAAERGFRHG